MPNSETQKARHFYHEVLDTFGEQYPRLFEDDIGMVKVLHAFEDKVPLVDVLLERGLLVGGILKRSSSQAQAEIASGIAAKLEENDLLMQRSDTTYANALPKLSKRTQNRPFILGDHGGYYGHVIPFLADAFGEQLVGVTEHTLNGEEKISRSFRMSSKPISYFSTARDELKERSDRDIAQAIAQEIVSSSEEIGKSFTSSNQVLTVLMVGYGRMGFFAAQKMKDDGVTAEVLVTDKSHKKLAFAAQDDFLISEELDNVIPRADIIILATNVIQGMEPVLTPYHFSIMKPGVLLTSMTSLDDEVRQEQLLEQGILNAVNLSEEIPLYSGPVSNPIHLMLNGSPANTSLPNGGAGNSIYMVEAAGLAGAFVVAQNQGRLNGSKPAVLSENDAETISRLWLKHFQYN